MRCGDYALRSRMETRGTRLPQRHNHPTSDALRTTHWEWNDLSAYHSRAVVSPSWCVRRTLPNYSTPQNKNRKGPAPAAIVGRSSLPVFPKQALQILWAVACTAVRVAEQTADGHATT